MTPILEKWQQMFQNRHITEPILARTEVFCNKKERVLPKKVAALHLTPRSTPATAKRSAVTKYRFNKKAKYPDLKR